MLRQVVLLSLLSCTRLADGSWLEQSTVNFDSDLQETRMGSAHALLGLLLRVGATVPVSISMPRTIASSITSSSKGYASNRPHLTRASNVYMEIPTLYDMPVSNNGARARLIIYAKGLDTEGKVLVEPPSALGGLKSEEYLKLNPQGKMPLLLTPEGLALYESDTIARYLIDAYSSHEPHFMLDSPEARALDNLISRIHDVYIVSIQGCMYKATPPFGIYQSRLEALAELQKQISVIEGLVSENGPFLSGEIIGQADAALFPTMVFMKFMLPKFIQTDQVFGPKLSRWWTHMTNGAVPAASKVYDEISGALSKWEENGRWDSILHAGKRDTAETTIFDKIINKDIPSEIVYEDDRCLVFNDISPAGPLHMLVIPKKREGLAQLRYSTQDHEYILGHLLRVAGEQGKKAVGDGGFRIVINDGKEAAQTVFHLHVHVIGGRQMTWPPG